MQANRNEEICSICNENLPQLESKIARMTCCGKGTHIKCRDDVRASSLSDKLKGQCLICRTKLAAKGSKEQIDQLRRWVEKGKAWAQCMLGRRYECGDGVDQSYQQARELYELAARQGYAVAQFNLGNFYREGQGVDQSSERAAEYYEAAARQGFSMAQNNLGLLYANGQGVDQSYERAREYYDAAARQGIASAQCSLGVLYYNGQGVKQSFGTAREWWMKSAGQGNEGAIKNLQIIDEHKGRATPSFTPPKRCSTCDAPETPSHKLYVCTCFGVQYCKNSTCQKSHWKIHQKEHRRLCKATNLKNTEGEMKDEVVVVEEEEEIEKKETATADSQQQEGEEEEICFICNVSLPQLSSKIAHATCCGKGMHIKCHADLDKQKNRCIMCRTKIVSAGSKELIEQIRRWVEEGKAWAQSMLGERYRDGIGVDQSYQQARELYELSALQGDAVGQFNLGVMYGEGQGVDQSYERATEYYEAAARQGMAIAQNNLGVLYANGRGVEQSNGKARELWMKSAEQGQEEAIKGLQQLDKFEGRTTSSFVPRAQPNVEVTGGGGSGGSGSSGGGGSRSRRSRGKKIKPNEPCPCGSGKKYKKCCK